MKSIELLAPAGNFECLKAAVMAGCDAVYLAGRLFGARAFADNFSNEELIEAIKYCHRYGVKVYVTANILIYDSEVEKFIEYIDFLHQNNVDAVIMQDLGMIDLVRKTFPKLEIHASTQMHIHNIDGVEFAKKIGLKRVVLARETNIDTIKEIKSKIDMPLEVFVHGALCISYSGQCLMSSLIGGRSGNRGTCAGSCRLKYDIVDSNKNKLNENEYPLSTKDLCTLENIGDLIEAGVDSFKIEGRMKSKEYVYTVVKLYRLAIDSYLKNKKVTISTKDFESLNRIFNREFTKGFLFNEENNNLVNMYRPNHQGVVIGKVISYNNGKIDIKLYDDLHIGDGIRIVDTEDYGLKLNEMYVNKKLVKEAKKGEVLTIKVNKKISINSNVVITVDSLLTEKIEEDIRLNPRKISINGKLICKVGEPLKLIVNDGENEVFETGNVLEKSVNIKMTKELVCEKISKIGYSIHKFDRIDVDMDDVFIPLKELNDIKRKVLEKLDLKREYNLPYEKASYQIEVPDFEEEHLTSVLIDSEEDYKNVKGNYDVIYSNKKIKDTILKMPRVTNKYEFKENVLIGEVGGLNNCKNVYTDFSLNVVNSYTAALLHSIGVKRVTLSYELTKEQTRKLVNNYIDRYKKHPNLEVITSAYEEVMISKFNLEKYFDKKNLFLKDRFNNLYKIKIRNDLMYIYNYKKRSFDASEYFDIGINCVRTNLDY